MTRALPETKYTCWACAHPFTVGIGDPQDLTVRDPANCPVCSAPVRWSAAANVGRAKDLLLTHYGARFERRAHGGVKQLLLASCLREEDVDAWLSLVEHMDFDAWKKLDDRLHGSRPSPSDRQAAAIREQARADAAAGKLLPELRRMADEVKAALQAERARYLAIRDQRPAGS